MRVTCLWQEPELFFSDPHQLLDACVTCVCDVCVTCLWQEPELFFSGPHQLLDACVTCVCDVCV